MDYVLPPAIARIPEARARFEAFMTEVGSAYRDLKEILDAHGRKEKSKEDARFVLPQAAETKIVVTMNCRALLHFFHLRCCQRAQWEIRDMAEAMLEHCRRELPAIFATAGAKCESLGYCPENDRFACGRYPTRSQITL
jgi:thymidylate synthase (FAD)